MPEYNNMRNKNIKTKQVNVNFKSECTFSECSAFSLTGNLLVQHIHFHNIYGCQL